MQTFFKTLLSELNGDFMLGLAVAFLIGIVLWFLWYTRVSNSDAPISLDDSAFNKWPYDSANYHHTPTVTSPTPPAHPRAVAVKKRSTKPTVKKPRTRSVTPTAKKTVKKTVKKTSRISVRGSR